MDPTKKQDILVDKSGTGKVRPWKEKKAANMLLSLAYQEIDEKKALRLEECASLLLFRKYHNETQKLDALNSCRVRLCPVCNWRRGLKIFAHTNAIMDAMKREIGYDYLFLTLTIRNCTGEELDKVLDKMMKAWNRFINYKQVKYAIKGWYRGLEITHDTREYITHEMWYGNEKKKLKPRGDYYAKRGLSIGDKNPNFDTYHPHFHCILAVDKRYFKDKAYIPQEQWTSLWEKAMQLDYSPIVDVRKIKGSSAKAVAEAAKYTVKDGDYIVPDDWDLTVNTVRLLDSVLHKRRLVAYGGKMKEWHKQLNLDDEVDGDLVHVDLEPDDQEQNYVLLSYAWNVGYNQYIRTT